MKKCVYYTRNAGSTKNLAKGFAHKLKPGDWLGLTGDLGAGKTTFIQGLAEGLGITDTVQSPTFVIAKEYNGKFKLVHVDLYRLTERDVYGIGLEDYCNNDSVVAVEWADKLPQNLKKGIIWLDFKVEKSDKRKISVSGPRILKRK